MNAIITLAQKDITLMFRDKFALFWIFAFPLMYALFFGSLFGDDGDGARGQIAIVVVDEDRSEASKQLIARLDEHESVSLTIGDPPSVELVTMDAARDLVRKGKRTAYIRIPAGYGAAPFAMFGGPADERPGLEVGIDPARSTEKGFLQGILMQTVFRGVADTFRDKDKLQVEIDRAKRDIAEAEGLSTLQRGVLATFMHSLGTFVDAIDLDVLDDGPSNALGEGMVAFSEVSREQGNSPANAFEITFPSAIVWGLMGVAVSLAITLVRERAQGTLLRLRVAPLSRAQLLAGKAFGCFLMCMIVMAFLMVFATTTLGVRIADLPLALMAAAAIGICFTGLMMTVSVMGKSEPAVAGAAWGLMMPFAMVGGGMIPLIAMPPWLLSLSDFSPFKWGILAMEGAVWRGFTFVDMLTPCGVLCGIGVVFFAIGVAVFRRIEA